MTDLLPIERVRVGDRVRKDMGDIEGLAESIRELGLLQPLLVRPDGVLICGARRLAALRLLNFDEVPVVVSHTLSDTLAYLRAERDENTQRKNPLSF